MQAVLVMFRNDGDRRSFSLSREMTVIGRRQDCDLMIPLGEISRKHCRIIKEADTLRIEDLGSSNGTYLNGKRIQEAVLSAGDTVQVGPVVFVLQIDGEPAEDDIRPFAAAGGAAVAAGAGGAGDDDDLEMLDDDGEIVPGPGAPGDEDLEILSEDGDEEPLVLNDETGRGGDDLEVIEEEEDAKPKKRRA
jgi:predicted component of type VI protein secretion system